MNSIHYSSKKRNVTEKYGKSFCAAPFFSLYEGENGIITTCCKSTTAIGNTNENSYEEVVNSEHMKKIRLQFLNNEKPEQCNACWNYEENTNTISDIRNLNNNIANTTNNFKKVIKSMDADGTIKNQQPALLDLLSTNKCNFSCLGCKPHLSSSIAKNYNKEFQVLHNDRQGKFKNWTSEWTNNNQPRINYIRKFGSSINRIHLNGGEPFLSKETYDLLDIMIEEGLHNSVTLWSHTNGSILKNYKNKDLIKDYFSIWKDAKISLSNDGFGKVGEYIRYGYNDNKWLEVFFKIVEYPNIQINIDGCLNIFNVFHLKEWGSKILQIGNQAGITNDAFANIKIWNDNTLNMYMLGACEETKNKAIEYLESAVNENSLELPAMWNRKIPKYIEVLKTSAPPSKEDMVAFATGIKVLDKKRKVKFAEACPELIPLYEKIQKKYM
jgi:organic radical activating enzyme